MTAMGIDSEPPAFRFAGQGRQLWILLQGCLGSIGNEAAVRSDSEDLIEGLVGCYRPRFRRISGVAWVDVYDDAAKGSVAMAYDLAEAEFRDRMTFHRSRMPDRT